MANTAVSQSSRLLAKPAIGGSVQTYEWHYQGKVLPITYETRGQGSPVLLLPAFSTVSTRGEMRGLAERLASQFQVVALDWLGFGDSARPAIAYRPAVYHQLLQEFVQATFTPPIAVVAAGHAAGYVLHAASTLTPSPWSRIVLVAPTWRGPLPSMMGRSQPWFGMLRQLVGTPLLGQALYQLNTQPSFLSLMYRRHVYTNPATLTSALLAQKHQITQQPGARFAPAAFVTGALDPVANSAAFLAGLPSAAPTMVVIGEQSPPHAKAEMEAMAAIPSTQSYRLPGSLGVHEEQAAAIADRVLPFLAS